MTRVENGGRIELRLDRAVAGQVTYRATLSWAADDAGSGVAEGRVQLDDGGGRVELLDGVEAAPAWLRDQVCALVRSQWRARQKADAPPWPRRLTRWRAARGAGS